MLYQVFSDASVDTLTGEGYFAFIVFRGEYYLHYEVSPVATFKPMTAELKGVVESLRYVCETYTLTEDDLVVLSTDNADVWHIVRCVLNYVFKNKRKSKFLYYKRHEELGEFVNSIILSVEGKKCKFKINKLDGHTDEYTPLSLADRLARTTLKMGR